MTADPIINVLFLYWGRRGLSRFAVTVAMAAAQHPGLSVAMSVSRQNEEHSEFAAFGERLMEVDLFSTATGALTRLWRLPAVRAQLAARLRADRTTAVVTLIPHVWLPFVSSAIAGAGVRHYVIVHDAQPHPGDPTGIVHRAKILNLRNADRIMTLSATVTAQLSTGHGLDPARITTLFHPDIAMLDGVAAASPRPADQKRPWRLLFLGRIQAYKGLTLLIDAVERLEGQKIELAVLGEGPIGTDMTRLKQLGAHVVNRWLSDQEIASALDSADIVVLPYIEASQSGIVAMAHGRGLPVIVTPVGGLSDQVEHEVTGIVADAATADAIATAIQHVFTTPGILDGLRRRINESRAARSPARFADALYHVLADDLQESLR